MSYFTLENLHAVLAMLEYLGMGLFALVAFIAVYMYSTPMNEFALIRNGNTAAGLVLGGAIVGYTIPLYKVITQSESALDFGVWAVLSLVLQVAVFYGMRFFLKDEVAEIENDHKGVGFLLASLSIAIGLLVSASMTV